jgi:hypothetical protein
LKDFIFSDPSETTNVVRFRTDLIGETNANFNIMKVFGLESVTYYQHKKRAILAQGWHIGAYRNKQDFIDFATAQGLTLVYQNSDGSNPVTLVEYDSDFGDSSW